MSLVFVFVHNLQALHFFIGFGALVSPLIADSFLSETGCGNHTANQTELIHHFRSMLRNSPTAHHDIDPLSHVEGPWEPTVHSAFWIMACINVRRWANTDLKVIFPVAFDEVKAEYCVCFISCPCHWPCCSWCIGSSWSRVFPTALLASWIKMNWRWRTSRGLRARRWSRRNMKQEVKKWFYTVKEIWTYKRLETPELSRCI